MYNTARRWVMWSLKHAVLYGLAVLLLLSPANAQIPDRISYQGLLIDTVGDPLNGTYSLSFFLYATPTGGTSMWTETHPEVPVTDGLFSVSLGRFTSLSESNFSQADRYLSVSVDGGDEMMPRIRMISVPYAFRVETIDGATGGNVDGNLQIDGNTIVNGELSFASTSRYLSIAPAEWEPTLNVANTENTGNEVHALTNFSSMNIVAPIDLPDSAVIEEIIAYVRDSSSDYDIQGWFCRNDTGLGASISPGVSTSGTPGVTALQVFSGAYAVDNEQEGYYIRLAWLSPLDGDPTAMAAGMVTVRYSITAP
jgi:hypothetical protein